MEKVKARLELRSGPHKGEILIVREDGTELYKSAVVLTNARCFLSDLAGAKRINDGRSQKFAVAWIEGYWPEKIEDTWFDRETAEDIRYNPRVSPYWRTDEGEFEELRYSQVFFSVGSVNGKELKGIN